MLRIQNKNNLWLPFNLLIALVIPFYGMAARGEDLNYDSVHLLMGNPSSATDPAQNPSNYLNLKPQYALSYNREQNIPNWQVGS
jgi:endonuclease G, mitochondrial